MSYKELWEDFYKNGKYIMKFPGEVAIKFFGRISRERDIKEKSALDFGCGVGRNTFFMSQIGLNAHGIEISESALELARERRNKDRNQLFPTFTIYDGSKILFTDNYFDFVISHGVLDHVLMKKAKELMKEIHRVSKPNALVELEIHSIFDSRWQKGNEIEKNVYIIEDDCEKGLPQHFFDRDELAELVEGFELKQLYLNEEISIGDNTHTSFWVLYLEVVK
jgi:ubiquinone/menaquinone biosynthesis C-methylase UbiE